MWFLFPAKLKKEIQQELSVYKVTLKDRILLNENYFILKYQKNLRKAEFYRRSFRGGGYTNFYTSGIEES